MFKLKAPYEPAGDQPKAIEEIVRKIERGEKHVVLMGATGTGKSLHPQETIVVGIREKDRLRWRVVEIGKFVEELSERFIPIVEGEGVVIPLPSDTYYTISFSPESLRVEISPLYAVSYHHTETLYEITFEDGRKIRITGDHNLYTLAPDGFKLKKTSELSMNDYIPLPRELPLNSKGLEGIYITDYIHSTEKIFIEVNADSKVIARFIESVYHDKADYKLQRMRYGETGISMEKINPQLIQEFKEHLILKTNSGKKYPNFIPLDRDFLEFLGIYIAEGTSTDRYIFISTTSPYYRDLVRRIVRRFGLKTYQRNHKDIVIYSSIFARLLKVLGGHRARDKRLPDFWMNLNDRQLSFLLRGIFDGDGFAGKEISLTTASTRLANDIIYALLRLGIWANSSAHSGNRYTVIRIYGREARTFLEKVGFNERDKFYKAKALTSRSENTNADVIPHVGSYILERRVKKNLKQRELSSSISRSAISSIELGKRFPSVKTLVEIAKNLQDEELMNYTNLRWTRVKSIRKIDYRSKVFDLSVEGNETFLAGFGGIFVHNTFTIANVIARLNRPTLILSHNKTLAAQLYGELKQLFPENAVEYFISYYDYYQPEAYIPETDTYIEKEADINDDIERLRLRTIASLMSRRDVIVVASVSAIYALGDPEDVRNMFIFFEVGREYDRRGLMKRLVSLQYARNDFELARATFSVRGEIIDIQPAYEENLFVRLEFWGDELERITIREKLTGRVLQDVKSYALYPATHFLTPRERLEIAIERIERELEERLRELKSQGKLLEAQRLKQRVRFDIELLRETGTCPGVENYSRHLSLRPPGSRPWTLLDYFPEDFLTVIDESHVTIPQLRAMYRGDRSRKETLVEYGFRLPSALDNRPLKFEEFEELVGQVIYMSATPGPYELEKTGGEVVEQIVRPTGIVDPEVEVRPTKNQIDDILNEIQKQVEKGERVLITTTTKKTSEELSDFLTQAGIKARYLHSELDAIERIEVLRELRLGEIDVVVGVNLLREGLDLPEVSLVIITDADKRGFLRSYTALIQTIGRAARNAAGKVILYADEITDAMRKAIEETERRRRIQMEYNEKHGIKPRTVRKSIEQIKETTSVADERIFTRKEDELKQEVLEEFREMKKKYSKIELIARLEYLMKKAADEWDFERAALYRDLLMSLRNKAKV